MTRWFSYPIQLPASAPKELRKASTKWEKAAYSLDMGDRGSNPDNNTDVDQLHPIAEPPSRKRKRDAETTNDTPSASLVASHQPPPKRIKEPDSSLAAAVQRMYPPKEIYHVRTSHITRPDQWHPIDQTTQDYHPSMRQPLNRQISWDDHGITLQTGGKVPHETVLDFLVDVMRNKHWRGDVTSVDINSYKLKWPRLRFYELTKIIASNPFLLRLSQMLEGRFTAAAARKLDYIPAVLVHGQTNQAAPIKPQYIAAILIQALGKPNPIPCSLCASTWNDTSAPSGLDIRPFETCVSLSSLALPPRFAACANHFWQASITDCSCVDIAAPLHRDERYDYFLKTFANNASNYPLIRSLFKDEFLQVASHVPAGFVQYGPFYVRAEVDADPQLFARELDLLAAVVDERIRGGVDALRDSDAYKDHEGRIRK